MAKVKGSVVHSNAAFLQEKLGKEVYGQILAKLDPADRAALGTVILQSAWYEYSLVLRLMEVAGEFYKGPASKSLAWEMGRFSAEYGLKTVYKIFFKVADPGFIISRASKIFGNYFDSGTMEVVSLEPRSAHLRIRGFDQPCQAFCDRAMGWMERTTELAGGKSVTITHPVCATRGGNCCDYVGRWL
jgi:hypothetical protein